MRTGSDEIKEAGGSHGEEGTAFPLLPRVQAEPPQVVHPSPAGSQVHGDQLASSVSQLLG